MSRHNTGYFKLKIQRVSGMKGQAEVHWEGERINEGVQASAFNNVGENVGSGKDVRKRIQTGWLT